MPSIINIGSTIEYIQGAPSGSGGETVYLLRDEFVTSESAPLTSPRTCEPGPGTLTVVDAANGLSIAGGAAVFTPVEASITAAQVTKSIGLCLKAKITRDATGYIYLRFAQAQGELYMRGISNDIVLRGEIGAFTSGEDYYIIQRYSNSGIIIIQGSTILRVLREPLYYDAIPQIRSIGVGTVSVDYMRLSQLPGAWAVDDGIATDVLSGVRSAGDTFAHLADCVIDFEVTTLPSSDQIELRFRVQDASNYWQVTIDSSGNLDLDEVVSGSATQRGTSAGVIFSGSYIQISAYGETISVFGFYDRRIHYTGAANFKTAAAGELETLGTDGVVTTICAYPRVLGWSALEPLLAI